MRHRSLQQQARTFLASTFHNDVPSWPSGAPHGEASTTFILSDVSLGKTQNIEPGCEITAVQFTCFLQRQDGYQRCGVPHRRHSDGSLTLPHLFHCYPPQTVLAIELIGRRVAPGAMHGAEAVTSRAELADDSEERVLGWTYKRVADIAEKETLDLRKGAATLMMLPTNLHPAPSQSVASITFRVSKWVAAGAAKPKPGDGLDSFSPVGVFVPATILEKAISPSGAAVAISSLKFPRFRLRISDLRVYVPDQWQTAQSPFLQDFQRERDAGTATVSLTVFAHNGYRLCGAPCSCVPKDELRGPKCRCGAFEGTAPAASVTLSLRKGAEAAHEWGESYTLGTDEAIKLERLPLHASTHLVFIMRSKADVGIGAGAFPLCPMKSGVRDVDLRVPSIPLLQGPFTCGESNAVIPAPSASPSAQTLAEKQANWYAPLPFAVGCTLRFAGTPTQATKRVKPTAEKESAKPSQEIAGATEAMPTSTVTKASLQVTAEPSKSVGPRPETIKNDDSRPVPNLARGQAVGVEESVPVRVVSDVPEKLIDMNNDIYAALKALAEQVDSLKKQLAGTAAPSRSGDDAAAKADRLATQEDESIAVVEVLPQRVNIAPHIRSKMMENAQRFVNPVSGERLPEEPRLTATALPITQPAIRFNGVTVPPSTASGGGSSTFPSFVELRFSFGPLAEQKVGALKLVRVGEDTSVGQTFALLSGDHTMHGAIWSPPLPSSCPCRGASTLSDGAVDTLMESFKVSGGRLYVEVYDAVSRFYVASGTVPLTALQRPRNVRSHVKTLDIPLVWDVSVGGAASDEQARYHPLVGECGMLHCSLCLLGLEPVVAESRAVDPAAFTCSANAGRVGRKPVVQVPRIQTGGEGAGLSTMPTVLEKSEAKENASVAADADVPTHLAKVLGGMSTGRRDLHSQRAAFAKQMLKQGRLPTTVISAGASPVANEGAERIEIDFRMKMVEKRRDESRAQKIVEKLRQRITDEHSIVLARGVPLQVDSVFVNPFAASVAVKLEFPASESPGVTLSPKSGFPSQFVLAPKEQTTISVFCTHNSASLGVASPVRCEIRTVDKGELLKQMVLRPVLVGPLIHRRVDLCGSSNQKTTQSFFVRNFASLDFEDVQEMDLKNLRAMVSNMCLWPRSSEPRVLQAAMAPKFDRFATTAVSTWEMVEITATVPSPEVCEGDGDEKFKVVLLHFFKDEAQQQLYETWAVRLIATTQIDAHEISYGQTSRLTLPVSADAVFCFSASVRASTAQAPSDTSGVRSATLLVRPVDEGTHSVRLHAFKDGRLTRYECKFDVVMPRPTHTVNLPPMSLEDCLLPKTKRLRVRNDSDREKTFRIEHNYKSVCAVSPSVVVLGPDEKTEVSLTLHGLSGGGVDGRKPQKYPIRIFINDDEDVTVDFYLLMVFVADRPLHDS